MSEKTEKTEKVSMKLKDIIDGRFLTENFISKQLKLLVLIVVLIVIFISNNYSCMKKLAEIELLKIELADVANETKVLSTKLTAVSRDFQVKEILKQRGINLSSPTSPAFEIQK